MKASPDAPKSAGSAPEKPAGSIAYVCRDGLYLNLTNRCPTACRFCIKRSWKWKFGGTDLRLKGPEPSFEQAWKALENFAKDGAFRELVFCGYGEPAYRLPVMARIGRRAQTAFPSLSLRLNTTGLGNLVWGRDIVPDLVRFLDAVSVSLNTADPAQWVELHVPGKGFRKGGFPAVLEFIRACASAGLETTVTAVDLPGVDVDAVRRLAEGLGAKFRLRPLLHAAGPPSRYRC